MTQDQQELTRRQALKALTAAAGGLALNFIPKAWKTPVVSVGTLPAHAQISDVGFMDAIATTTTMVQGEVGTEYGDFDFSMCTPNGYYIWDGSTGDGATSSLDNISFDPVADNETISINPPVPGTYSLYLENYSQTHLEMTIQITTNAGVYTTSFTLSSDRAVADVTFPGGTVTWRSDLEYPPCSPYNRSAKGK